jgi:hypothetical protein
MSELKKETDLEFKWSKESELVDKQWEHKMNNQKKPPRLEDYIDFLESVRPAIDTEERKPRISVQFTL